MTARKLSCSGLVQLLINKSFYPDTPVWREFSGSFACSDYPWSFCYDKIVIKGFLGYFALALLSRILGR